MPPPVKPPPPHWSPELQGDTARMAVWKTLTNAQRDVVRVAPKFAAKRLEAAKIRLADGTASVRTQLYVERGRNITHESKEAYDAANALSIRAAKVRELENRLASFLEHGLSCTTPNCPVVGMPLLCVFDKHHPDPSLKTKNVAALKGKRLLAEIPVTVNTCVWHHFEVTRDQRNMKPANEARQPEVRMLGLRKQISGCQHPLHATMPYASLVEGDDESRSYAFHEVAHVFRNVKRKLRLDPTENNEDLNAGVAVIHCRFCARIWTLCETSKLSPDTPYSKDQFPKLLKFSPAFVQHFEQETDGFDWEAERARLTQKICDTVAQGKRRRSSPSSAASSSTCSSASSDGGDSVPVDANDNGDVNGNDN